MQLHGNFTRLVRELLCRKLRATLCRDVLTWRHAMPIRRYCPSVFDMQLRRWWMKIVAPFNSLFDESLGAIGGARRISAPRSRFFWAFSGHPATMYNELYGASRKEPPLSSFSVRNLQSRD